MEYLITLKKSAICKKIPIIKMILNDIIPGRFLERLNRFTVQFKHDNVVDLAHLRDPGRLRELLKTDAELLLRPARNTTNRKTRFDVLAVRYEGRWVLINSGFHSDLASSLIESNLLKEFNRYSVEKREYTYGKSRLDFLLSNDISDENLLLEVKGCTLVENGIAKFPDAPTTRGKRHLEELIKAKEGGFNSAVLFLILRDDASLFSPNWEMDREFSQTLKKAREKGVIIKAYSFKITLTKEYLEISPFKSVKINI